MSISPDRRTRKRLATRQAISDAATRLFMEQGFDHVTVDQIAEAADVGRMTVFNHFPRKEDMFFDRDEEVRELLRDAVLEREAGVAPIDALRQLVHRLVAADAPLIRFTTASQRFIATVEGSATLMARTRAIRDEVGQVLAALLAAALAPALDEAVAQLAASMFLATLTVALLAAHRAFRQGQDAEAARALFLALVDRGCAGVTAALAA